MEELGRKSEIDMRMVSIPHEDVGGRLSKGLLSSRFDLDEEPTENLLLQDPADAAEFEAEGMLHSFFGFGHVVLALDGTRYRDEKAVTSLIQELASSTHASGVAFVGSTYLCRNCGQRSLEKTAVCPHCGDEAMCQSIRKEQGTVTKIVRL